MTTVRLATRADEDAIWEILRLVIASGDTLVLDPTTSRKDALAHWLSSGAHVFVAERGRQIVGSYILKPNQPGLGAHIANAGFIVSPAARGLGIGKRMGEHCLAEARRLGFRAMQFNIVVSTNDAAVRLWQQLGFKIIATVPGAFRHSRHGFVDAHIMFRTLD